MEKKRRSVNIIFLSLFLLLIVGFSHVDAKIPDVVVRQKKAVVTIYVNDRNGKQVVSGSGFIIDRDGIIATNCAVITKWLENVGHTLVVRMEGDTYFPMEDVFSCSYKNNLALLKINAHDLPAVKLASRYKSKKREAIFVIGSPSGSETTISGGLVRNVSEKDDIIQISFPIAQGSSGSPVFNVKGEVIAVATLPLKKKKSLDGAVSIKHIKDQLEKYKKQQQKMKQKSVSLGEYRDIPLRDDKPERAEERPEIKLDNAESYFLLGCSYDRSNMYKEAIEAYQEAIRIKPEYGEAYVNLGVDYYKLGRYSEALDAYTQALKIKQDSQSVYNKVGTLYIILGEYSLALHTFKQAVGLDSKNSETHFNLGIAYFLNGDKIAAFEEYMVLKELDTDRAKNLFDLLY